MVTEASDARQIGFGMWEITIDRLDFRVAAVDHDERYRRFQMDLGQPETMGRVRDPLKSGDVIIVSNHWRWSWWLGVIAVVTEQSIAIDYEDVRQPRFSTTGEWQWPQSWDPQLERWLDLIEVPISQHENWVPGNGGITAPWSGEKLPPNWLTRPEQPRIIGQEELAIYRP